MRGEDPCTPGGGHVHLRITPACAGKTSFSSRISIMFWDHPRMRGEDARSIPSRMPDGGSPPHARGRRKSGSQKLDIVRITPACAGKTEIWAEDGRSYRDHPRMRGEDHSSAGAQGIAQGSPPHARGRQEIRTSSYCDGGITPACAGKTFMCGLSILMARDHPRMRGEDALGVSSVPVSVGSPPHARGRPAHEKAFGAGIGITPACAGKTRLHTA